MKAPSDTTDLRDAPAVIATIKIEARIQRGTSVEQFVGLKLTLRANQTPAEIAGWNLGVIHNRTDAAMLTFIKGQTGIEHTAFLRDAKDGKAAVEALKAWIARKGGVDWGQFRDPQDCVVEAQRRKLGAEAPAPIGASKTDYMNLLGERIRAGAGA